MVHINKFIILLLVRKRLIRYMYVVIAEWSNCDRRRECNPPVGDAFLNIQRTLRMRFYLYVYNLCFVVCGRHKQRTSATSALVRCLSAIRFGSPWIDGSWIFINKTIAGGKTVRPHNSTEMFVRFDIYII